MCSFDIFLQKRKIFSKLIYSITAKPRYRVILRIFVEEVSTLNSQSNIFWPANFLSEGRSLDYVLSRFLI